MSEPIDGASVDIRSFLEVPRRRWRVVVLVAVLAIVAVIGYIRVVPPVYKATTDVRINPVLVNVYTSGRSPDDLVNTQTEAQIAASPQIAQEVAKRLGSPPSAAKEMRSRLTVTPS